MSGPATSLPEAGTTLPLLYSFRRCPYAMRARLALAASQTLYTLHEVTLKAKPAALLQASPKGTVPVLVLPGGQVIDQSLDIMRWALAAHDPLRWLQPSHASLDDMLALVAGNDGPFKHHLDRYKYPGRYAPTPAAQHRDAAAVWLASLETRLALHTWLCGNRPSLADMALLPFVRQFAATDAPWFAAQAWPRLQAWLHSLTDTELFAQVMAKPAT